MTPLGNFLWILGGGLFMACAWWLAGAVMMLTLVGIPWGRSCFVLGKLAFLPFGREVISRRDMTGRGDWGTGMLGQVGNLVWFILAGWWLGLLHSFFAILTGLTVIGIPFALQHIKMASLALWPVGKTVVKR